MNAERLDPQRLSAWLDGELDEVSRAQVDAWLRDHPDDAAEARLWAADRELLRAHWAAAADEPVPPALARVVWRGQGRPRLRQAAAAAALLALGVVVGAAGHRTWQQRGAEASRLAAAASAASPGPGIASPWVQRAAVAHSVYVPEVRHPVEVSVTEGDAATQRAQEEHLARWLTKRLSVPVTLFDLRPLGWQLVGGRLLPDATGPSAQLMYQQPDGQRVTVYLRKPDAATPAAFRYEQVGRLGMFYWVDGQTGYALVGELPRERLLAIAEQIDRQLPEAAPGPAAPASR